MGSKSAVPGFYEFLIEAELQQYYSALKNELKVQNVSQLKYVSEDDMAQIGMSRPEMRRLVKFFHKHCPQTYLAKMKKKLLQRRDDSTNSAALSGPSSTIPGRSPRAIAPGRHIIQADAIVSHKTLGSGEFGTVQQGVWTSEEGERIQVAIKCLSQERMENNPVEFLKEAAIMHSVDHEHIVRLYGVVLDTSSLVLVTELAPLRSLLECLKEPSMRPNLTIQTLFDFSIQICSGMEYLESKRLIHRDLAARNILVFSKSKVKISDFGLSRALGVGKDYYQTNFNVNLKLPIAWCAPECINFLRFTSASDVWAFGVTLWEMYSYGFQPWAALTGQQILDSIDEPNYHRLERPESAPAEIYYQIMLKCWQHDPADRPTFVELLNLLPECKPELVQAIRESSGKSRDYLSFEPGDLITVIDKKIPGAEDTGALEWKGVLKCGKTGLFNPAHTITYLGSSLPSAKDLSQRFQRNDSRSSSLRKGRLSADMISRPQGDFKHTGHVGPDGHFFGDIAFINSKSWVPRQVVPPYKPESPISRDDPFGATKIVDGETLSSDTDPLLWEATKEPLQKNNWKKLVLPTTNGSGNRGNGGGNCSLSNSQEPLEAELDHEYHEISDEENEILTTSKENKHYGVSNPALCSQSPLDSPFDKAFDMGPSLMEEVFGALEEEQGKKSAIASGNELEPASFPPFHHRSKKKFATVKPISSKDRKRLDTAIAIANELASRSMLDLDQRNSASFDDISGDTPASPTHRKKFSFLLGGHKGSEKERRNYTQEAASIPDIQSTLSDEAKEAYNSLIEKPTSVGSLGVLTPSFENKSSSFHFPEKCSSKKSAFFDKEPLCPPPPSPFFDSSCLQSPTTSTAPQEPFTHPAPPKAQRIHHAKSESWNGSGTHQTQKVTEPLPIAQFPATGSDEEEEDTNPLRRLRKSKVPNVLPLPPKRLSTEMTPGNSPAETTPTSPLAKLCLNDKKTSSTRHQRKHPLLIPQRVTVDTTTDTTTTASHRAPPPPPKPQRQHLPSSPPKELEISFTNVETRLDRRKSSLTFEKPIPLYENYDDEDSLESRSEQKQSPKESQENGEAAEGVLAHAQVQFVPKEPDVDIHPTPECLSHVAPKFDTVRTEVEYSEIVHEEPQSMMKRNSSESSESCTMRTVPERSAQNGADEIQSTNFKSEKEWKPTNSAKVTRDAAVPVVNRDAPVPVVNRDTSVPVVSRDAPVVVATLSSADDPPKSNGCSLKVKTVQRILGSSATERDCEWALDMCREDSAHAVKLLRLRSLLPPAFLEKDVDRVVSVLEMSHWDVARASDFLLNTKNGNAQTKRVTSLRNLQRRPSVEADDFKPDSAQSASNPKYIRPTRV